MVLRMARPEKHPKTGVFYLRKRVPADLIALVGRPTIKRSLGTKDVAEARRLHAEALAEIEARWRNLRAGYFRPTAKEMHALAGEFYRAIVRDHEEGRASFFFDGIIGLLSRNFVESSNDAQAHRAFRDAYGSKIDGFCEARGIRLDPSFQGPFDLAVARAVSDATDTGVKMMVLGDYSPDPAASRFPLLAEAFPNGLASRAASMKSLRIAEEFEAYSRAAKLAKSTQKRWGLALKTLEAQVGHDDLSRVTSADVSGWISTLRMGGRSERTIRDVHLAGLKALLGWLVGERRLATNVASGFRIKVAKSVVERSRSLSDKEAAIVLAASLEPPSAKLGPRHAAARRWVPWLCAYTGARLNELTQIRKEDITIEGDIPVLRITPEAGTVKTGRFRLVPLHPHLKEQGFLDFVRKARAGPLFYEPPPKESAERATPPFKKLGERLTRWARSIGLNDPRVDPFHGWRHRFKTVGRSTRIASDVLDAIQGHVPRTEGGAYGEFDVVTMYGEIARMPRYQMDGGRAASPVRKLSTRNLQLPV